MNFKEILELIDKVAASGIAGVEVEQAGTKVRIDGKSAHPQVIHSYVPESKDPQMLSSINMTALPAASSPAPAPTAAQREEESEAGLHVVTSPIVGTFYRSPNPEADPFVNIGDRVTKGKVICIVEAMKLMNEIECDADGVVARIYPQNGQPVEYGEKLFALRV